jgi:hypothetical protein
MAVGRKLSRPFCSAFWVREDLMKSGQGRADIGLIFCTFVHELELVAIYFREGPSEASDWPSAQA